MQEVAVVAAAIDDNNDVTKIKKTGEDLLIIFPCAPLPSATSLSKCGPVCAWEYEWSQFMQGMDE